MPRITNINELRNDLLDQYDMLKRDPKRLNQCAELANTAGKVIASVKLELEFAAIRGETPECEFLKYNGSLSEKPSLKRLTQ